MKFFEAEIHEGAACFSGESSTPIGTGKVESQSTFAGNRTRRTEMRIHTAAANINPLRLIDRRPHPQTIRLEPWRAGGKFAFGGLARQRSSANVAPHFGIGFHLAIGVQIRRLVVPKEQPL